MTKDGEFSRSTRKTMARQAGETCSAPWCERSTAGASKSRKSGVSDQGEAAHIKGRTPRAARWDSEMSPKALSDIDNGIWLCRDDAKLVDDDEIVYTVELLRGWREAHLADNVRKQDLDPRISRRLFPTVTRVNLRDIPAEGIASVTSRFVQAVAVAEAWGDDVAAPTGSLIAELVKNAADHAGAPDATLTATRHAIVLTYAEPAATPFGRNDLEKSEHGRGGQGRLALWTERFGTRFRLSSRLARGRRTWTVRNLSVAPDVLAACTISTNDKNVSAPRLRGCAEIHLVVERVMSMSDARGVLAAVDHWVSRLPVLVTSERKYDIQEIEDWITHRKLTQYEYERWPHAIYLRDANVGNRQQPLKPARE